MRRTIPSVLLVLTLLSITVMAGCIQQNESKPHPTPPTYFVINGGMNAYVNCSNAFAFEMYGQLATPTDNDNVFFSPYSISTALGMAYEGARGQTATEMEAVLDLPADAQTRWDMVQALQERLNPTGKPYTLAAANAYWLADYGTLVTAYQQIIEDYYLAHGERLDFDGDPAGAVATINAWVESATNGRIKNLLSVNDIQALTYLILTNAVYFKSDWYYQFDTAQTADRPFTLANGASVSVPTMHMCNEDQQFNYAANDDAQLIQLPYAGEELSMFVLLPRTNDLTALEAKLDPAYLRGLKSTMTTEYVDLSLPKFKLEEKYELNAALIALGMPTAFGMAANFSGITSDMELYIGKVIHQSFVEVDEKGTEAAAATAVIMVGKGVGPGPEPIVFNADHPFVFLIEHKASGQILFMGRLADPRG